MHATADGQACRADHVRTHCATVRVTYSLGRPPYVCRKNVADVATTKTYGQKARTASCDRRLTTGLARTHAGHRHGRYTRTGVMGLGQSLSLQPSLKLSLSQSVFPTHRTPSFYSQVTDKATDCKAQARPLHAECAPAGRYVTVNID
ncbi:hypothetical protein Bbelb_379110 [Branchiostoma belcheri]|nr:hypothetical protein Bbelb_379110 [Branchiostoma belcheri]